MDFVTNLFKKALEHNSEHQEKVFIIIKKVKANLFPFYFDMFLYVLFIFITLFESLF